MDILKVGKILEENGQPKFRLDQIKKAIFQDGVLGFSEISNIPQDLREILGKEVAILPFKVKKVFSSRDKKSVKALFELHDKNLLESVLMLSGKGTFSVCVSCQAGCPLGCQFCATGRGGLKRNLSAQEIESQVLFWRQWLKNTSAFGGLTFSTLRPHPSRITGVPSPYQGEGNDVKISNIVYMGMGEPFLNWMEVKKSLLDLLDPKMFGFGSRSISLSTSGIPEGIEKLSEEFPQVNLAVSLHFSNDEKRSRYMPVNRKYNLECLRESLQKYFKKTKRKVFLEYVILSGINDGWEDAKELLGYIRSIGHEHLLHVNFIAYNSDEKGIFKSSDKKKVLDFRNYFLKNKINCTIRKSFGEDISAACGQLAGKDVC